MEQNSDKWLQWRANGIGSSDAPILLGVSPFKTPFQLWEEKTGRATASTPGSFITNKGHRLEPVARAKYELEYGIDMPPILFQHEKMDFIRASMDGGNMDLRKGLEIKYVGIEDFTNSVEKNIVPEKYYAQVQHQLLASGFKSIDYLSFYLEILTDPDTGEKKETPPSQGKIHVIEVFPDLKWLQKYIVKAQKFWDMVQSDTPPKKTDKDTHNFIGTKSNKLAKDYIKAHQDFNESKKNLDEIKEKIIAQSKKYSLSNFLNGQLKVSKVYRKGSIDYGKIPELENVNLDIYRKPQSMYIQVKIK